MPSVVRSSCEMTHKIERAAHRRELEMVGASRSDKSILPTDPKHADKIPEKQRPEYLYCGAWYHFSCLKQYMESPPFKGGKTCLECGRKIVHPRFSPNEKELERKWQQKQARRKEVEETKDAMGL